MPARRKRHSTESNRGRAPKAGAREKPDVLRVPQGMAGKWKGYGRQRRKGTQGGAGTGRQERKGTQGAAAGREGEVRAYLNLTE